MLYEVITDARAGQRAQARFAAAARREGHARAGQGGQGLAIRLRGLGRVLAGPVITSYSIHYTKLYDQPSPRKYQAKRT